MSSEPKHILTGMAEACSALVERQNRQAPKSAEDNVQDACLRALQLGESGTVQNPVHYLMRIARNLFIDKGRSRLRTARIFQRSNDIALIVDEKPGPEQHLAGKQLLASVLAEIDRLPPRCREAFLLHRFEEASYPVIARRMGISVSMVEKHIAVAMVRLEKVRDSEEGLI